MGLVVKGFRLRRVSRQSTSVLLVRVHLDSREYRVLIQCRTSVFYYCACNMDLNYVSHRCDTTFSLQNPNSRISDPRHGNLEARANLKPTLAPLSRSEVSAVSI